MQDLPKQDITGVILAGGMGRRMGRRDKGLLLLEGRPLVAHVIDALFPQVGTLLINANRSLDRYRKFGHTVVTDMVGGFFGPLVGIASAMEATSSPYVLSVPCDSPLAPQDLCAKLYRSLTAAGADICAAHDGNRMQPLFALLRRELLPDLLDYLRSGKRKTETWYSEHRFTVADFSDRPDLFVNINTPQELAAFESTKAKKSEVR